jgi:hypothetical protein
MTALNRSTRRRLQQLRQLPSVWEGDRRAISPKVAASIEPDANMRGECILWVDGTEAMVRAMDVVPAETGPEAIVRTLIRAMETPHASVRPGRPQKIVVCNREIQFFLRGVLQDLGITIDYVQDLPLIDEIFRGLQEIATSRQPQLPPEQAEMLMKAALDIWNDAPWEALDEEKILSIELNYGDVGTLYVSILGMLGVEYGILMYRSLDSLKQFRQQVLLANDSPKRMEEAFLEQDCFFVTFDQLDDAEGFEESDDDEMDRAFVEMGIRPSFGNLHPLEGLRPSLYEEEAIAVLVALTALHRFFQQHQKTLNTGEFPPLSSRYRVPDSAHSKTKVSVTVATMPDLAEELFQMSTDSDFDDLYEVLQNQAPILRDDLIPSDAFFSLGAMSWEVVEYLRLGAKYHQPAEQEFPATADGFPVILIQTSRPKAIALIEQIQAAGGLESICFNPGKDPLADKSYDLGILKTQNGEMHLFGEFEEDDPVHIAARKKWDQRCKKTKGFCGLVIARGLKGASRGKPEFKDMMALFETRSLSPKELGLGTLEMMPQLE